MKAIHGAESWELSSDRVSLAVTRHGGMVGPVAFDLGGRTVAPYSLSPWTPDDCDTELPELLRVLRGDFFCFPFGPQEDGPPHGAPANHAWHERVVEKDRLVLVMEAAGGSIEREIALRPEHAAIYCMHRISGVDGAWSYGTHPVLDASQAQPGSVRVSVSPFRWASVYPGVFSDPARGERQMLLAGARFEELSSVPTLDGGAADLTRWPYGWHADDLVMMVAEPVTADRPFAWSAAVFDDFVWFSLKHPGDFPATLFWLSDGGRDAAPWKGRHLGRIGIEEVCSHFSDGVDRSREDLLEAEGIPTTRRFSAGETVSLPTIQAVAPAPSGFGLVTAILPDGKDGVRLVNESGESIPCAVDWSHVAPNAPLYP